MSLILDALNKADREREYRDTVPDINTVHGVARAKQVRHHWIIAGLSAGLLVLLVLLLVVWWRSSTPAVVEPVAQANSEMAQPSAASTPPAKPAPPVTEVVSKPVTFLDQEVQALYQPQEDTRVVQVVEPKVQAVPVQPPAPATPARRNDLNEETIRALWEETKREFGEPVPLPLMPQPQPVAVKAEPARTKTNELPADILPEETLAGHPTVPFLHELPVTTQNKIPTLMYAKHQYDNGIVVLNKEELQVGMATREGVLLERILADGVLLSYNGTPFKLGSLSSWVNY